MERRPSYLLPQHVRPSRYDIRIKTDLERFTFAGEETIDLSIRERTHSIVLNATELSIQQALLKPLRKTWNTSQWLVPREVIMDEKNQRVTLWFGEPLSTGFAELKLAFTGEINDQLSGMYRSMYELPDGTKKFMATTQCESLGCRRIFPGFDQPDMKARFKISLEVPENLVTISNMPEVCTLPGSSKGYKLVHFAESPPMSTYLVAMIAGEFEYVEGWTKDGVRVRIYATPGKKHLCDFALETAISTLEYYTDFFDFPYYTPKLDLIAIPDFQFGAMENLGANTYRETALLIDPKNSAETARWRVREVVWHELGHQWFGDLVTPKTFEGLWLKEGFANFMELMVGMKLDPASSPEDNFIISDFIPALLADALKSSRPVHLPIRHQDEIEEMYDAITYSKGSALIRMYQNFIGPEAFQKALQDYIETYKYQNVEPHDLWRKFEKASGKPIEKMMDAWIRQVGYPLINVKRVAQDGKTALQLSQERFLYEREGNEESSASLWEVPIGITSPAFVERKYVVLDARERELSLEKNIDPHQWLKLNAAHTGFFRVYYEPEELYRFLPAIEEGKLGVADRIELLDDTFALVRGGYYTSDTFLEIASAYKNEQNLFVWQTLLPRLGFMRLHTFHEAYRPRLETFVRELVRPCTETLGWDERSDESDQMKILRGMMLATLGHAGDENIIAGARSRFAAALDNPEFLNPNIRGAVYGIVAAHGDQNTYEEILVLARKANFQEEKLRLYDALTAFNSQELTERTLDFLLSREIRSQDVFLLLRSLGTNPFGRKRSWEFAKEHWDKFASLYKRGAALNHVINAVARPLNTFDDEADVRTFFEKNPLPTAERTLRQCLEAIRINARWLERNRSVIGEWLENWTKPVPLVLTTEALMADVDPPTASRM